MWPSKKGLGARLSYGVNGNGVAMLQAGDTRPKLDFARRDDGQDIHEIVQPFTSLVEGQLPLYSNPELQESLTVGPSLSNIEGFIPSNIVSSLHHESDIFTSSIAHDPNFRNIFKVIDIRNIHSGTPIPAICYVGGPSGNVLNISYLNYRKVDAVKQSDHETNTEILFPELSKPYQITLTEQIKQIEVPRLLYGSLSSYLILRTNAKIYVLNCVRLLQNDLGETSDIEVETLGAIHVSQLSGFEFADVSFNPHDFTQFGVIDVKGNFCIWRISSTKRIAKVNIGIQTVETTNDLSNWKRMCWTNDLKKILILTRTSIDQFHIDSKEKKRLITSQTWSRIRDFQLSEADDHGFLLTSKELVWINLSGNVERMISWKHFLDDSDPSLKLSLNRTDMNEFTCIIHSEVNPLLFVYTFAFVDNKPYSIKDPYYITRGDYPGVLKQVLFLKLDFKLYSTGDENEIDLTADDHSKYISCDKYGLFEISSCLGVSIRIFSSELDLIIRPDDNEEDEGIKVNDGAASNLRQMQYFNYLSNIQVRAVFESLKLDKSERIHSREEAQAIQAYAYSLGEGVSRISSCSSHYLSLLDVSNKLSDSIEDVTEFDTMLEQLAEFYQSKDVHAKSLVNRTLVKRNNLLKEFGGSSISNLSTSKDIYSLLKKIYMKETLRKTNSKRQLHKASIILSASLIKSKSDTLTADLNKEFSKELESSSLQIKSMLESWDVVAGEIPDNTITDTQPTLADTYRSMPSIVLSSSQSQRNPPEKISSRHKKRLASQSQSQAYAPSPLSQSTIPRSHTHVKASMPSSSQMSTIHSSQSRGLPSQGRGLPSQTRSISSQTTKDSSQRRKKRKGGFA